MKVAIVHYWLVGMRGGEKVIEAVLDLFPDADIYTHVADHDNISDKISQRVTGTTFIQKLPKAKKWYQSYLPLMPYALEQLDLTAYDLVISSESGPAKGVIVAPDAMHICYCHSPMRYLWDMYPVYQANAGFLKRMMMPWLTHHLRLWDLATSYRVDHFIANSSFVQKRIAKYYRRDSTVIHPPVVTGDFYVAEQTEDFYLMVGQLVSYKNTELAVQAFNHTKKRLIIIGDGPEFNLLKAQAGDTVQLLGYQSFEVIKKHYATCQALIFPGVEDFGMVPVEAMASGRPVIALGKGGALDSIIENETGIFFTESTVEALNQAIEAFEKRWESFDSDHIRIHAMKFDVANFKQKLQAFISDKT